jgi:hypothetical protein
MGSWWVMGGGASSCWTYTISNSDGSIVHQGIDSGSHGSSVRCIRD